MSTVTPSGKQAFIDKICHDPLSVSSRQLMYWCSPDCGEPLNFDDLRRLILRVFDQNEKSLLQSSDASVGKIGWANKKSSKKRYRNFFRRINNGFRKGENKIIVAEGDSWFQFPFFIQDIVDHLKRKEDCAVYSMAYGGDWLTNIIYEGKYIEDISLISPDVFLISGGGNDLVGASRIAMMVDKNPRYYTKYRNAEDIIEKNKHIHQGNVGLLSPYDPQKILSIQHLIKKELYSFLWILFAQFYLIFQSFQCSAELKNMLVLTQGYDYPIPHKGFRFDIRYPLQPLVNWFTGSSKWLYTPLMLKGISEKKEMDAILHAFIFEFNLIFMEIVQQPDFPNVIHIDCRGVAKSHDDWFDELHLKSHAFEKIGKMMYDCIKSYGKETADFNSKLNLQTTKIVRVTDFY